MIITASLYFKNYPINYYSRYDFTNMGGLYKKYHIKYDSEKKYDPEFFHLENLITIANPSHIHTLGYEEVQGFHTGKNMCGEPSRL